MNAAAALLASLALGWITVRLLLDRQPIGATRWSVPFELALTVAVSAGLTAVLFLVSKCAGLPATAVVGGAVVVSAGVLAYRNSSGDRGATMALESGRPATPVTWVMRALFGLGVILILVSIVDVYHVWRHGWWDAFGVWNLRARFLTAAEPAWRIAFTPDLNAGFAGASHPGYPLLLSGWVAYVWSASGGTPALAPAVIGALFSLGGLLVLVGGVAISRGEIAALSAGLVLLATRSYFHQSAWQVADIPLSVMVLGSTALLAIGGRSRSTAVLAGLLAGFAPWTKNEGWPFLLALLPVAFYLFGRYGGLCLTLGSLPGVVTTLLFRLYFAQGSEQAWVPISEATTYVVDPHRWSELSLALARTSGEMGYVWAHPFLLLPLLVWALRPDPRRLRLAALALPVLVLPLSTFGMMLVFSSDLSWHAGGAASRLMLQPWPALVFVAFVLVEDSIGRSSRAKRAG
jgi:hypothetical protein